MFWSFSISIYAVKGGALISKQSLCGSCYMQLVKKWTTVADPGGPDPLPAQTGEIQEKKNLDEELVTHKIRGNKCSKIHCFCVQT